MADSVAYNQTLSEGRAATVAHMIYAAPAPYRGWRARLAELLALSWAQTEPILPALPTTGRRGRRSHFQLSERFVPKSPPMPTSRKHPRPALSSAAAPRGVKRRTALWIGGGVLTLGGLFGAAVWWQSPTAPRHAPGMAEGDLLAETDADLAIGEVGASVLVEYASLTCSACAAFAIQIWPELERRMVRPGRLRFLYRDFPLDSVAFAASVMVRALPAERRLPAIKDLYAQRDAWVPPRTLRPSEVRRWVADRAGPVVGLEPAEAFRAISDGGWERRIARMRLEAQTTGIDRVPTFVLPNRKRFVGLRAPAEFVAMVERARS